MRADNEHVPCNSVESDKDDAKPHECPENNWQGTEPKMAENGKANACCLFCDSRGDKWDKEKDGKMLGRDTSEYMTDAMNGDGKEKHFSGKGDSLGKGSVFYMDKSVMACDLPEIVVCYKESTYHVVKDICVDEGVPVQEKFLFDEKDSGKCILNQCGEKDSAKGEKLNDEVEEHSDDHNAAKCDSQNLTQGGQIKDDTIANMSEMAKAIPDVQKSSIKDHADAGDSGKYDQEDSNVTIEVKDAAKSDIVKDMPIPDICELSEKIDSVKDISTHLNPENLALREVATAGNVSKECLTLADILSMENGKKSFTSSSDGPEEQSSQKSSGDGSSENAALVPEVEDSNDSNTVSQVVLSPEKASSGVAEGDSSGCKNSDLVDLSSVSTSEESIKTVTPSKASRDNSETGLITGDPQKPETEHHMPRYNHMLEDSSDHTFSSHFPSGLGEASFSASEPVSGLITYSGPIAFSGSLSVRSDGSTTSTRSFAFPVLQSEWNSSPVRMAKADRRHLPSRKGWRQTLFCCKF